ncbi:DUF4230 domain-containing protein [uncultured Sphingomonas sp.]|uniref:DUF4230 domain-containing protein n=1 Tax=uncultured Sphingomonas sp. TaxID=158754 RepID=UPI002605D880|nr:DUF4230 domain-containing protein [uncultured Sphingomonas sp.]
MNTVLKVLLGIVLAFLLIAGGLALVGKHALDRLWSPTSPETIATASLQGLQAENRLTALVATYVAVVTSSQQRFGLSAQRTLIMPGRVRYEVDLARLTPNAVTWHGDSHTLDVVLPPLLLEGPEIDPSRMRAYDGGGLLLRLTDSRETLDASNRKAAEAELVRQAREAVPMGIARTAARQAVTQNFALPLKAAGLDPQIRVRFADEPGFPAAAPYVPMDRSRSLAQVFGLSH